MECPGCKRQLTANDIVAENETEKRVHCFVCDYEGILKKSEAEMCKPSTSVHHAPQPN
jgi:hypothetical protein